MKESSSELIGVTSFIQLLKVDGQSTPILNQAFTRIHYHFKWISEITGLDLPNCQYLNGASGLQTSKLISLICAVFVFLLYKFNA